MAQAEVRHDEAHRRFSIGEGEGSAILTYRREDDRIVFTHTIVPPEMEGQGVGSRLVSTGLEFARSHGLKVVPLCSFVRGYVERHEEHRDLLA